MDYPKIDLSTVDLLALIGADVPLRLKSKHVPGCGPEYCGPSPDGSASQDGFIVWPDHPKGKGLWWNRPQDTHGDAVDYLRTYKGMSYTEAVKALTGNQAIPPTPKANGAPKSKDKKPRGKLTHTFDYDATHRVLRFEQLKALPQTLIDGVWVSGESDKTEWPLWNEETIYESAGDRDSWVLFVEGEKTARALEPMGFIVTTAQGGAGRAKNYWQPHYTAALTGRNVAILRDQDQPGHEYGETVAQHLYDHAARIKIIDLPGIEYRETHGDDPENWRDNGGRVVDLQRIILNTPDYRPTPKTLQLEPLDNGWRLVPANEVKQRPPLKWLLPDKLALGCVSVLFGDPGTGKSALALGWAVSIAQQHTVIYAAGEGTYQDRLLAQELQTKQHLDNLAFFEDAISLTNDTQVDNFISLVYPAAPTLIVFDTLARIIGGDENSTQDMQTVMNACERIARETGAAILLVHHSNKAGGYRGNSALKGAISIMMELQKDDDRLKLTWEKARDRRDSTPEYYRILEIATRRNEAGEQITAPLVMAAEKTAWVKGSPLSKNQRAILECLNMETFVTAGCKAKDIAEICKIGGSSIHSALSNMLKFGYVRQSKKGDPYFITEEGKVALH